MKSRSSQFKTFKQKNLNHPALWAPLLWRGIKTHFIIIIFLNLIFANSFADEAPTALVKTQTIQQKTLTETLPVYGIVNPDNKAIEILSFEDAVLIAEVKVQNGQAVKKGAPLLIANTDPLARLRYQQASADAQATLLEYKRQKRLYALQLSTKTQVEAAKVALQNAKTSLQIQIQQGNNRAHKTLSAPFDAVVLAIFIKPGDRLTGGTPLLQIGPNQGLFAELGIDPEKSLLIKPGMPLELRSLFDTQKTFSATIKSVASAIDPQTHLVNVSAALDPKSTTTLLPGTTVEGKILIRQETCSALPSSALLSNEAGSTIFQVINTKAKQVKVTPTLQDGEWICITGNFDLLQPVVVLGNYELQDGMQVRTE